MDKKKLASEPLFFELNRVFRIYLGGLQYAELRGEKAEDTLFPEEFLPPKQKIYLYQYIC